MKRSEKPRDLAQMAKAIVDESTETRAVETLPPVVISPGRFTLPVVSPTQHAPVSVKR